MNILKEQDIPNDFRKIVCMLIDPKKHKRIAEIGVWKGDLSKMIIRRFKPEYFLMVDPLLRELNDQEDYICTMGEKIKTQRQLNNIAKKLEKLPADFKRMTSLEAVKEVEDSSLDFVFIDALHKYEAVKEDIQAWLPKIRKGGILAGDDYHGKHMDEVKIAVDELLRVKNIGKIWYYEV